MMRYIGHGLRQDLARMYAERTIEAVDRVLQRHVTSEDDRAAILREIRTESAI